MGKCLKFDNKQWLARLCDLGIASDFGFRISVFLAAIPLMFLVPPCFAQENSTLPLEGWYRTGRYMPVRVVRGEQSVAADGAVPLQIDSSPSQSTIVPLLVFADKLDGLQIDGSARGLDALLRPLSSHQQLVAVAGAGDRLAETLFPGETIVTVHVDPLDPLPGPTLAWQTLDALIIDGPWPGSFDLHKLPALLAGGTEIAVRSPDRPAGALPWESVEGGWVLRPAIDGPIGCDGNDLAYAPAAAWNPDLPGATRAQIFLAGVLFSIAALACLLLPRHLYLPAIIAATIFAVIAIGGWQRRQDWIYHAQGEVIVERPLMQIDRWQFVTSPAEAAGEIPCSGEMWPIFADPSQAIGSKMALRWSGTAGRYTFVLQPNARLGFVSRSFATGPHAPAAGDSADTQSPMMSVARALYAHGHERFISEPGAPSTGADPAPLWAAVQVWPRD
jgi:hypothetical protein